MRLRDQVEVVKAAEVDDGLGNITHDWDNPVVVEVVPAYVGYVSVDSAEQAGHLRMIEQLRVVAEPFAFDPVSQRIRWRGVLYTNDGPPMVRLKDGIEHHVTVVVKQVSAA